LTDIPDNVDLQWIARHLIEFRDETRRDVRALNDDVAQLKDEVFVLTALVQRLDHKFDRLARRVGALEQERER